MRLMQIWEDDFSLSKNFTRRELNKFMETVSDLPMHIKEDMYNKLSEQAVKHEFENIVMIIQRIIITSWHQISNNNLKALHNHIDETIEQYKEPDAEYSVNYLEDFDETYIQIIQRVPGHKLMVNRIILNSYL